MSGSEATAQSNQPGAVAAVRQRIVILGGGTAGWMAAAALSHFLARTHDITLIESEEIGIVGVGEATLPHLRAFIRTIGLDEAQVMRETNATFKLGIEFTNFGELGESYFHPFGDYGVPMAGIGFHHFWLAARGAGSATAIDEYSLPIVAGRMGRFAPPPPAGDLLDNSYGYAYQFDAARMAPMLRRVAESRGVQRIAARVDAVLRDGATGDVTALTLDNGTEVAGDLFVDCSGFRGLIIGAMQDDNWEDWSHWLPCDRAVAAPCHSKDGSLEPFTRATAMSAGWRWRIPLQHRVGNGYVYSSAHISDDAAADALVAGIEGAPLADPRVLKFRAGRRRRSWVGNVVAVGLASGFLEPLESTSIHLVQMAITRLVELFPAAQIDPADRAEFNRLVDMEYDRIRDFLILHYHATRRNDSSFWNHVRTMAVPDSLASKLALWNEAARIAPYGEGLFLEPSWIAVLVGQGIVPARHDPRATQLPGGQLRAHLGELQGEIAARARAMPGHRDTLVQLGADAELAV